VLRTLAVENYRSLRRIVVPLHALNVVTGGNGTGKSSLYRALRLLADTSRNGAVAALAREGGLPSTLWAGPESIGRSVREGRHPVQGTTRRKPVALRLGFAGDEFGYAVDFGLPVPTCTQFGLDPEIKRETVWAGPVARPAATLVDRFGGAVRTRDEHGRWSPDPLAIGLTDSVLSELADPRHAPELLILRERMRTWRFYDHFRTDAHAPARSSQIGTRTPVLGHDGADVAAALQTILEIGDTDSLEQAVDNAFPGGRIEIGNHDGRFALHFRQHGLLRPLGAAELSEGTLRYLLWCAALLTPRPPELLVLNEPETSLHPDLLPPLAHLITTAAAKTQLVVVSHSAVLIRSIEAIADELGDPIIGTITLTKEFGETVVVGQEPLDQPSWHWPKR
jgi:predicted ATPase